MRTKHILSRALRTKDLELKNEIRWSEKTKNPDYKQYIKDLKGVPVSNLWMDIFHVNPMALENSNYPTQKPEDLLKRIEKINQKINQKILGD